MAWLSASTRPPRLPQKGRRGGKEGRKRGSGRRPRAREDRRLVGCVPARRNQLCCRNRYRSLRSEKRESSPHSPRGKVQGTRGQELAQRGKPFGVARRRAGATRSETRLTTKPTAAKFVELADVSRRFPFERSGAHYAAQAAWRGALTHTDGRHFGLWRARPFTRARSKQPRSLGEGKPFSTQTGL